MLKALISSRVFFLISFFFVVSSEAIVLEKVQVGYKNVESFQRFTEFFTGIEVVGEKLILRTDDSNRDGYYWMCDLDKELSELPDATYAHLEVYVTGSSELLHYKLPIRGLRIKDTDTKQFFFGVTGKDWSDLKKMPIAWRIWIEAPEGEKLAEKTSFVWEMPKSDLK